MNVEKTLRAAIGILAGILISPILGYFAFWFFAFVLGSGIDIDDDGTRTQHFFDTLAVPAGAIVVVLSLAFAVWKGVADN